MSITNKLWMELEQRGGVAQFPDMVTADPQQLKKYYPEVYAAAHHFGGELYRMNDAMHPRIWRGAALVALDMVYGRHPLDWREVVAVVQDWSRTDHGHRRHSYKISSHEKDIWCACVDRMYAPQVNGSPFCAHVWAYKISQLMRKPFAERSFYGSDDLKKPRDVNGRGSKNFLQVLGAVEQVSGEFFAYPSFEFRRALAGEIICDDNGKIWRIVERPQRMALEPYMLPHEAEYLQRQVERLAAAPHVADGRRAFETVTNFTDSQEV